MTLDLGGLFFWLLFAAPSAVALGFGIHWAADKWLGGSASDKSFYWALGAAAVTIGLVLLRYMPG